MTACRNGLSRIGTYSLLSVVLIGACSDTSPPRVSGQSATDILDELDRKRRERESRTPAEILTELRGAREDGDEEEEAADAADWFAVTPDNDATARARRIEAAESATAARRAQQSSVGAHALPWYEGGTLHSATGRQWLAAPARNRLATAADFVSTAWRRDGYTEKHIGQMVLNGFLRAAAEKQVDCITRMLNESTARERKVARIAAVCYLTD